ncbi:hypothetical protein BU17DRAFT_60496 [Hysterangium stoloniferum]|nr:hypothetical protein BU17DRAFT_60496 [Hysterangium stoloniferum]
MGKCCRHNRSADRQAGVERNICLRYRCNNRDWLLYWIRNLGRLGSIIRLTAMSNVGIFVTLEERWMGILEYQPLETFNNFNNDLPCKEFSPHTFGILPWSEEGSGISVVSDKEFATLLSGLNHMQT